MLPLLLFDAGGIKVTLSTAGRPTRGRGAVPRFPLRAMPISAVECLLVGVAGVGAVGAGA